MPENARYVRYIGLAHVREITAAQWVDAAAKGQKTTVWSVRNGWKLPIDKFTDNALDYLKSDTGFVVDADLTPRDEQPDLLKD